MNQTHLDIIRIKNETGAEQVTVTNNKTQLIECDLLFIRNHAGIVVKAKFDMIIQARFTDTCKQVKDEATRKFLDTAINWNLPIEPARKN